MSQTKKVQSNIDIDLEKANHLAANGRLPEVALFTAQPIIMPAKRKGVIPFIRALLLFILGQWLVIGLAFACLFAYIFPGK
jgi:hypothetical protein